MNANDLKNYINKVKTDAAVAIAQCDKALARPAAAPNYSTNLRRAMSENGINYGASGRIISVQ